jgi:esterase/lipase superfamily enzyme
MINPYPSLIAAALLQVLCDCGRHRRMRLTIEVRALMRETLEGSLLLDQIGDDALLADALASVLRVLHRANYVKFDAQDVWITSLGTTAMGDPSFQAILGGLQALFESSGFTPSLPGDRAFPSFVYSVPTNGSNKRSVQANLVVQRIHFVTDRALIENSRTLEFSGYRAPTECYTFGYCDVSIPRDHRLGRLESPALTHFEFRPNPQNHVVVVSSDVMTQQAFESSFSNSRVLMFIHGYNVGFTDAVRRTAQIAYDTAHDGMAICYSWPSQHDVLTYAADAQNAVWTAPHLHHLFSGLCNASAQNIDVIAHSMGSQALVLSLHPSTDLSGIRLRNVILAAPDIDAAILRHNIGAMQDLATKSTLYASCNDKALQTSKRINGYPRAGDTGAGIFIEPGVETIDVSAVNTDFLGHSYFGNNLSVVSDLYYLIKGQALPRFHMAPVDVSGGRYWRFMP